MGTVDRRQPSDQQLYHYHPTNHLSFTSVNTTTTNTMAVRAFATSRVTTASSSSPAKARSSSAKRAAKKVLQKATKSALGRECKRKMVLREFQSLKSLIPSVSAASKAVSPLEVVLEAIEYIQQLERQVVLSDPALKQF